MKNMKLGTKLSLSVAAIMIAAFALMIILTSIQTADGLRSANNAKMLSDVQNSAQILDQQLTTYKTELESIALRPEVMTMNWSQAQETLMSDVKRYGFLNLFMVQKDGSNIDTDGNTTNLSSRAYFKTALSGKTNLSDPLVATTTHKLVVMIATPIKDADGNIVGVLGAEEDGAFISGLVKNIKGSTSGYGFVLNASGTYIGSKDQSLVKNQTNIIQLAKKNSAYKC